MQTNNNYTIFCLVVILMLCSCASQKKMSSKFYFQHEKIITNIEQSYKAIYAEKPFSIGFNDKNSNYISIEIITDSLKYIYEFDTNGTQLKDTLAKYHLPFDDIKNLVVQMRAVHCTWINNLDYYVGNQKSKLVFMAMRPVSIQTPLGSEKYFILTFYTQPQYFDTEGRLLANRRAKRLRKIDGEIFHRINDKVCYTVSERFR